MSGVPVEVPNLRLKSERDKYRFDVACTDKKIAGDQVIPVFSLGNPEIPKETYNAVKKEWERRVADKEIPY